MTNKLLVRWMPNYDAIDLNKCYRTNVFYQQSGALKFSMKIIIISLRVGNFL